MRVSAILVIVDSSPSTTGDRSPQVARPTTCNPLVCEDILGRSVLDRTIARLRSASVETISLVVGSSVSSFPLQSARDLEIVRVDRSVDPWREAQRTLRRHGVLGIETSLVIELSTYMEFSVKDSVAFNRTKGFPLTQFHDNAGPLDSWIVDCKWFSDAGGTLPFREDAFPGLPVPFPIAGYVNRLNDFHHLRALVVDTLLARCEMKPIGREIRPGIWADEGARVHRTARLVAPVYLARSARVGRSAVITRFSNIERHAEVGDGTAVHLATILPNTILGRGLDVSDAVVKGNKFFDLGRNVGFEVDDPKLIRDATRIKWPIPVECYGQPTMQLRHEDAITFQYQNYIARAAGRLSGVFFKGANP